MRMFFDIRDHHCEGAWCKAGDLSLVVPEGVIVSKEMSREDIRD
jgi:hypothetical protein